MEKPRDIDGPVPSKDNDSHATNACTDIQSSSASAKLESSKFRLRKACDSCSIRKVKCDEQGPPCLPCASLSIPCTYQRPSRRRGPPNRHAEAIKRKRQQVPSHSPNSDCTSPTSLHSEIHQTLRDAFAVGGDFSAELICPLSFLLPLIDDYFTYIHPLVPLPHEPTFREALARRHDVRDRTFLAMLSSMVGALVISFPRKPRLHMKKQNQQDLLRLFPNYMVLVDRCRAVAIEARGPGFLDKDLSIYDATTSYLLGLSDAYAFRWRQSKLYFGECLNVLRAIGVNRMTDIGNFYRYSDSTSTSGIGSSGDFVVRELSKRLFWVLFVGIRSMHQLGASTSDLYLPPESRREAYPPLPAEVDDAYISPGEVHGQPSGVVSLLVGFNANIRVFRSDIALADLGAYDYLGRFTDWECQVRVIEGCLASCKRALNSLPDELLLKHGRPLHIESPLNLSSFSEVYSPKLHEEKELSKRVLQYEIQKANIYVSQLGTRSQIADRYWLLLEVHQAKSLAQNSPLNDTVVRPYANDQDDSRRPEFQVIDMSSEREAIVEDLLRVLGSISQVNMEPNGASLIYKIRQIASTLLQSPTSSEEELPARSRDYLITLVELLMKLDRVPSTNVEQHPQDGKNSRDAAENCNLKVDGWSDINEEEELQNWADLREYQSQFAKSGGVLSNL